MHILVTRSGEQGMQLVARLARLDLTVSHYAPVQPGPVNNPAELRGRLLAAMPVDIVVVPSSEALHQIHALAGPEALAGSIIVVPGRGTASIAAQLGFAQICCPQTGGTSERILELPELQSVAGRRILIAAAAGGRGLIGETLKRRGALVRRLNVYQRCLVPPPDILLPALAEHAPLVTLLASGGALEGLHQQLPQDCWQNLSSQAMIAPSERVARLAAKKGCQLVLAATAADDSAMLAVLQRLYPRLAPMR